MSVMLWAVQHRYAARTEQVFSWRRKLHLLLVIGNAGTVNRKLARETASQPHLEFLEAAQQKRVGNHTSNDIASHRSWKPKHSVKHAELLTDTAENESDWGPPNANWDRSEFTTRHLLQTFPSFSVPAHSHLIRFRFGGTSMPSHRFPLPMVSSTRFERSTIACQRSRLGWPRPEGFSNGGKRSKHLAQFCPAHWLQNCLPTFFSSTVQIPEFYMFNPSNRAKLTDIWVGFESVKGCFTHIEQYIQGFDPLALLKQLNTSCRMKSWQR